MAALDPVQDAPSPAAASLPPSRDKTRFGAIGTLRVLLIGSILVPLLAAAVEGYFSYRSSYQRAVAALAEAVAVAEENTTKILDTHVLVAARIDDLLANLTDDDIRAQEKPLHDIIARHIEGLPQVAAAWAIDLDGHALVSARVFPVNRDLDHSSRDDFQALQHPATQTYIWALRARSLESGDLRPYFTVSRRRQSSDGRFRGITVVAVAGDYFASFYSSLLGGSTQYAASVLREDGTSLASYPDNAATLLPEQHDDLLAQAIAARAKGGIIANGGALLGIGKLVAYKRLANYPVYVAIGRTHASILSEWLGSTLGYAAIGVPAALGLMLLSLLALRRAQREQFAVGHARAIEAELHQAQRERTAELSAANDKMQQTIEELEAARLLAEAASKAKSDFLANMSHELRTPLNAIIGFSDLMREEILGPVGNPTYRDYASDIHFSGTHLLEVINDILDVVRHESGKMELKEEAVDVETVINEALRLIAPQALRGEVQMLWQAPKPALPPLYCDRVRLRQILLNLLSNAVKFTGPAGTVEIRGELGAELQLVIRDSGIGIKPEDIARIMTPFGQVASVYSRSHQGTGLGLTLTKALVERHGGRLSLYSAPNIGTTVRVTFPAERLRPSSPGDADAEGTRQNSYRTSPAA